MSRRFHAVPAVEDEFGLCRDLDVAEFLVLRGKDGEVVVLYLAVERLDVHISCATPVGDVRVRDADTRPALFG